MLREIQYLRGIAALMVVIYHTYPQLKRMGYDGLDFTFLSGGVDIFFVISGFIMTYISYGRTQSARTFLRDRFLRIAPLYWILTCVVAIIGAAVPAVLQSSAVRADHLIASMAFLPAPHPVSGLLFPLVQPGWTLNYEMYFYLIFSLFVGLTHKYRYLLAIMTIVALTALASSTTLGLVSQFYGNYIVLEFCFGIALGLWYCELGYQYTFRHGAVLGGLVSLAGSALMLALAALEVAGLHAWTMGLPATIIVAGALVATRASYSFESRLLQRIGDASYSLYLTHFMTMSLVGQITRHVAGPLAPGWLYPAFVFYSTVICVAVSMPIFERLERPLHRMLKQRFVLRQAIA